MIVFNRRAGTLRHEDGEIIARGIWAGHGDAANDPEREQEHGIGPLPAGWYAIGPMRDSARLGKFVMNLDPFPETEMYGRSLMRMHGDTLDDTDHEASDGCIIAPRPIRRYIDTLPDRRLLVV